MAIKIADAYVNVTGQTKDLERDLRRAQRVTTSFLDEIRSSIIQEFGASLFHGLVNGARRVLDFVGTTVQATSDLTEALTKSQAIFGDHADELVEWSKTASDSLGLSQRAALEATATLGNMFVQLGQGTDTAKDMSVQLVELAGDLASFHNVAGGAEEVLTSMSAALRGEFDSLQKYIPTINAAAIEQEAFAQTGKTTAKQLTVLDKALATHTLIIRGAGVAMGDLERTMMGVANQQRELSARLEEGQALLGSVFTPLYNTILRGLNEIIEQVMPYGEGIVQSLATGLVRGIIYLLPAIAKIRDIFVYWFQTHSPPKILPEIAKWGADTINEWLLGMTKADFGILKDLGTSIESILRSYVATGQIQETDLVSRVFGSQNAIARAIDEWNKAGRISANTMALIRHEAGPAGQAISGLVEAYFNLASASKEVTRAQEELNQITERYAAALSPLQDELDAIGRQEQEIRNNSRLRDIDRSLKFDELSAEQRQLLQLEKQRIQTQERMAAIELERDEKVGEAEGVLTAVEKEQKARQEVFDQQEAQFEQQLKANQLIGEEKALRERLAAEGLAAQEKALRELEAEQRKADAANKERLAELERLYQSTLRYNMATTDTEGQIALLRLELLRHKEGSAEYFDILTQIAGLEERLAEERKRAAEEGVAGGGPTIQEILGDPLDMDIPGWVKDLNDELNAALDEFLGTGTTPSKTPLSISDILREDVPEGPPPITQDIKDFVTALDDLVLAAQETIPVIQGFFEVLSGASDEKDGPTASLLRSMKLITLEMQIWAALLRGDLLEAWRLFWEREDVKNPARPGFFDLPTPWQEWIDQTNEDIDQWMNDIDAWFVVQKLAFDQWLTDVATLWSTGWNNISASFWALMTLWSTNLGLWFTNRSTEWGTWLGGIGTLIETWDIIGAGTAFVNNLWSGMKTFWDETVMPWWRSTALGKLVDMLPGSEPEDTSSPLYGLKDRGKAIISNIWEGAKETWKDFSEWWSDGMQWIIDQIPELPAWMGGGSLIPQGFNSPDFRSGGSIGGASAAGVSFAPGGTTNNTTWGDTHIVITVSDKDTAGTISKKVERGVNDWQRRTGQV